MMHTYADPIVYGLHCPHCQTWIKEWETITPCPGCAGPRWAEGRRIVPPDVHQRALAAGTWKKTRRIFWCQCGRRVHPGGTLIRTSLGTLCEFCAGAR